MDKSAGDDNLAGQICWGSHLEGDFLWTNLLGMTVWLDKSDGDPIRSMISRGQICWGGQFGWTNLLGIPLGACFLVDKSDGDDSLAGQVCWGSHEEHDFSWTNLLGWQFGWTNLLGIPLGA